MPSLPHSCALNLLEYGPASHLFHAESPPGYSPGGLSTMGPAPGWYGRSAGGQRQPRPAPVIASDQFWRAPAVPAKVHLPTDRGDLESASTEWAIHPGPASDPATSGLVRAMATPRSRASSSSKRKMCFMFSHHRLLLLFRSVAGHDELCYDKAYRTNPIGFVSMQGFQTILPRPLALSPEMLGHSGGNTHCHNVGIL